MKASLQDAASRGASSAAHADAMALLLPTVQWPTPHRQPQDAAYFIKSIALPRVVIFPPRHAFASRHARHESDVTWLAIRG